MPGQFRGLVVLATRAACRYSGDMDTPPYPAHTGNCDDDVPREGLPPWPTPEQFHAVSDHEDAQVAAGVVWADVDVASELRDRAAALEAEIVNRRT